MTDRIEKSFIKKVNVAKPCYNCGGFTTAMNVGQWGSETRSYCKLCSNGHYFNSQLVTDAVFSCPKKVCAKDLSFEDFFKKSCCETSSYEGKLEKLKKIQSKMLENYKHKCKLDAQIEETKKKLEEALTYQKKLEQECQATNVELMTLTTEICGKDVKNKFSCEVCFEAYNDTDHIEVAISCGHRFCLDCLSRLKEKNCPTCRNAFNDDQMTKLF